MATKNTTAPRLEVKGIRKTFGQNAVLKGINLSVDAGEVVALIGGNGAGKSTLMKIIMGIYSCDEGDILIDGQAVKLGKPAASLAHGIYLVPQEPMLFPNMTVLENVLVARHMRMKAGLFSAAFHLNMQEEKRIRQESLDLLYLLGLGDVADEKASSLPYGKQRYLEIARALATEPRLLLLDEPAAGMNPQETIELTNFIRSVRDEFGLTIFLIEHHMNLVMDISDRIYVIDFGKQIAAGVPAEIQNDQRVIDAYLGVDEDA